MHFDRVDDRHTPCGTCSWVGEEKAPTVEGKRGMAFMEGMELEMTHDTTGNSVPEVKQSYKGARPAQQQRRRLLEAASNDEKQMQPRPRPNTGRGKGKNTLQRLGGGGRRRERQGTGLMKMAMAMAMKMKMKMAMGRLDGVKKKSEEMTMTKKTKRRQYHNRTIHRTMSSTVKSVVS